MGGLSIWHLIFAAVVILLLWLYNSVQILVLGAALNAELERQDGAAPNA